jgi:hypothetical protein
MAKNSKKKGNRGENQLVHILCEAFGEGKFKRTPSSGAYTGGQNRELAVNLPWEAKITLASDIITPSNFNFIIEHKFYEGMNFWDLFSEKSKWNEWVEQAGGDAAFVNKEPMIVIKYNRHDRIALVRSPYLMERLKQYNKSIRPMLFWTPANTEHAYAVVWLADLLDLPREFWFSEEG